MARIIIQAVFVCWCLAVTLSNVDRKCTIGECIPLNQCTGLNQQLKQGNAAILNLTKSLHCGFDNNPFPNVCCPSEFLNSRVAQDTSQTDDLLPAECGIQNLDRIFGGTRTRIDEHPWMALLRYDKPKGHGFYCGGVIISKRYILTAAHCIKGSDLPKNWKLTQVRLGEWNLATNKDCESDDCSPDVLDIPIEDPPIVHKAYHPTESDQHNDIALLRLAQDIPFSDFVKPICLPSTPELMNPSFDRYRIEVAGWGKTETRSTSDVKLKVLLPIVNNRTCFNIYKKANRVINDRQLCAGGLDGQDSCRGDSGGPLMGQLSAEGQSAWVVFGVVSYGPSPCGTEGWPGVYTRVSAYMDWIKANIRP